MGYVDIYCHLCGVPFSIVRLRTINEPRSTHAWPYNRHADPDDFHDDMTAGRDCKPFSETGCSIIPPDGQEGQIPSGIEHIAGPGCRFDSGYSGYDVSVEEARACRAIQAIVEKSPEQMKTWQDESDDEEWERETSYFRSGVGDGSPDEAPLDDLDRNRHGMAEVWVYNWIFGDDDSETGMPVHPTCWSIFRRVSLRRIGRVDVHGLFQLWKLDGDTYRDYAEVEPYREQWWRHERGSEWLIANPVDIPGFREKLKAVEDPNGAQRYVNWAAESREDVPKSRHPKETDGNGKPSSDPFNRLPEELRLEIVSYLSSRSVAALRLSSRAFRQLPVSLFRPFVLEDMPWLWEAESMEPGKTDWYLLYTQAKTFWGGIKGLMNRARIWKEIEDRLDDISEAREKGKIKGWTG